VLACPLLTRSADTKNHLSKVFDGVESAHQAVKKAYNTFDKYRPSRRPSLQQAIAKLERALYAQQEALKKAEDSPTILPEHEQPEATDPTFTLLAEHALTRRKLTTAIRLVDETGGEESTRELKSYLAMVEKTRWLRQRRQVVWVSPCQHFNPGLHSLP